MTCYAFAGLRPVVSPDAFVHPDAVLIGDVIVGAGCYVAPLACLRGDFGRIVLAPGSNVQDTCVMHGFPGSDTVVEEDGHVGHGAVLHGCRIGRNALTPSSLRASVTNVPPQHFCGRGLQTRVGAGGTFQNGAKIGGKCRTPGGGRVVGLS